MNFMTQFSTFFDASAFSFLRHIKCRLRGPCRYMLMGWLLSWLPLMNYGQTLDITTLQGFSTSTNTANKPQSKVWIQDGDMYCVMPDGGGAAIWKLNGTSWSKVNPLDNGDNWEADVKIIGDVAHIMLFDDSQDDCLVLAMEYDQSSGTYGSWSQSSSTTTVDLGNGSGNLTNTATFDIDSQGRMWIAYERDQDILVRWADAPYTNWNGPYTLESGTDQRDLAAVVAFTDNGGSKVGVIWSNQNDERFGFKFHNDGDSPTNWSSDEIPGDSYAQNQGLGMADDHLNFAVTSDGTLYVAAKTSYDKSGFATMILLVRRPNSNWDYYEVEYLGTKPIVIVNEANNFLNFIYSYPNNKNGDIVSKQAALNDLGSLWNQNREILMDNTASNDGYDYASSTKSTWSDKTAVIAFHDGDNETGGALLEVIGGNSGDTEDPTQPMNLTSPLQTQNSIELDWDPSTDNVAVTTYNIYMDGANITSVSGTSYTVTGLSSGTSYDFQVSAEDAAGNESALSATLTESTLTNQAPIASFTANPPSGTAPVTITFDAGGSNDPDGTILSYDWDFGDGTSGAGSNVDHTFNGAGDYTVMLTVTDNGGETGSTSTVINVGGQFTQSITFDPLSNKLISDGPFAVNATASSGLAVSFSIVSGPATVAGNTITLNGTVGTVTVRASQAGDANYFAAADVDQSFQVSSGVVTTISGQVSQSNDDAEERNNGGVSLTSSDLEMADDGSSKPNQTVGMRFSNMNIPQGAVINNAYIEFTVDDSDSGPSSLNINGEATDNAQSFSSSNGNISGRAVTGASTSWAPGAWTSGQTHNSPDLSAVVQEIVNRAGWASGNAIAMIVTGSGERTAHSYDGEPTMAPILHVEFDAAGGSGPFNQVITFDPIADKETTDGPFVVTASASSGLAVSFNIVSGPATISGSTITLNGTPGTVVVRASQGGDANYNPAPDVDVSFNVTEPALLDQTITFDPIPNKLTTDAPFAAIASASSGLQVSFSIVSGPATVSGNTITLNGTAGTVVVRASQGGDVNYNPAPNVDESFVVTIPGSSGPGATLGPLADAHVINNKPDNNYGSKSKFEVRNKSSWGYTSFLKFDLSGVSGVTSATLRIYGFNDGANNNVLVNAFETADSWTESGITFNNAPAAGAYVNAVSVGGTLQYYEIDVTSYVFAESVGDGIISFQLQSGNSGTESAEFNSKEASANHPQLVINGGASSVRQAHLEFSTISVYPNPFQDEVLVDLENTGASFVEVQIFNMMGQELYKYRYADVPGTIKVETDPRWQSGVYILRLVGDTFNRDIRIVKRK